ncbi:MAG TPA: hypothetical protein VLT61_13970, partial [Anaeromyxobacteraceae bacterium]|nr:hypothetical protein [Anaeromyxobacteraceae bacterium]
FTEKLEAARDALSHSHPGADVEAILEAGLDLLIERAAKRKARRVFGDALMDRFASLRPSGATHQTR